MSYASFTYLAGGEYSTKEKVSFLIYQRRSFFEDGGGSDHSRNLGSQQILLNLDPTKHTSLNQSETTTCELQPSILGSRVIPLANKVGGGGYIGIALSVCSHYVRAITSYSLIPSG